ncbi:fluoride efflux transporter FluC [Nonomuraea sp. NPDC050394]|uniref:fluoride efflux transporter FluC n=1 Tax=Nonomuraea sp. NPDC050394 TaxID=3364363 RepID=UPI0037A628C0
MNVLLVAIGAAVGAPARFLLDRAVQGWVAARGRGAVVFPWGTLVVNVIGSAVLGFLVAWPAGEGLMALAGTGLCGALSTYSTLGYETLRLAEGGAGPAAAGNAVLSVAAGLGAAAAGAALAHAWS